MSTYKPPYTPEHLARYVNYIELPSRYHPSNNPPLNIELLTALHVHQISTAPYENLSLHYSANHSIVLDPEVLYDKVVTKACNRGGYCMENSLLFLWKLQAYGFDVYPTGVRIRLREDGVPKGEFVGLVHLVLICTLESGEEYVLDVSFGGDGPIHPLRLVENSAVLNLGTQEVRYVYETLPQNAPRRYTSPQKYWIYQYRNGPDKPWNGFYAFGKQEFLINDFNVMNFFTSGGQTFQRTTILVIKFLRSAPSDAEDAKITGKVMLVNGTVKRNTGGKTEVVEECHSEVERVQALKTWFGITLMDAERHGIKGLVTELKEPEESIENGRESNLASKTFSNVGGLTVVGKGERIIVYKEEGQQHSDIIFYGKDTGSSGQKVPEGYKLEVKSAAIRFMTDIATLDPLTSEPDLKKQSIDIAA